MLRPVILALILAAATGLVLTTSPAAAHCLGGYEVPQQSVQAPPTPAPAPTPPASPASPASPRS